MKLMSLSDTTIAHYIIQTCLSTLVASSFRAGKTFNHSEVTKWKYMLWIWIQSNRNHCPFLNSPFCSIHSFNCSICIPSFVWCARAHTHYTHRHNPILLCCGSFQFSNRIYFRTNDRVFSGKKCKTKTTKRREMKWKWKANSLRTKKTKNDCAIQK